ncbi:uncharacterized protein [Pyrus communis]|uniref:uncharacterized protein isoform X2 n=1 Tax=Pyrus communis TaxID=23211 RepID=UPI0035C0DEDA
MGERSIFSGGRRSSRIRGQDGIYISNMDPRQERRFQYVGFRGTSQGSLYNSWNYQMAEEFTRAVRSSYARSSCEDARERHRAFIVAIEEQVSKIEKSLKEAALSEGKASQPWVRLDEGECNELAFFLSGPSASEETVVAKNNDKDVEKPRVTDGDTAPGCSKNSCGSNELGSQKTREEKSHGHRRTASDSADIGAWKIAVFDDGYVPSSSAMMVEHPVRKIPSMSGFLSSMETASKLKWSKNGFRKWKAVDRHEDADTALLPPTQLTRGINACLEKNKSCLDSCDECYDKPLYGWYGAIQRQLQRSQYYMQYSWPARVALWIGVLLFLIVFALRAI